MARRSRKTLQAEGQLSLFAMTDDFLFAVTENTENAVDKAAESRSYVCLLYTSKEMQHRLVVEQSEKDRSAQIAGVIGTQAAARLLKNSDNETARCV